MPWICTLLMACLLVPSGLVAQTEADRESVNRVVQSLLADSGQLGDEIPHSPGAWSLVIARFADGDSREVQIPARAGEEYMVSGYAESHRADVDICVYDPAGDPVDCDTLMVEKLRQREEANGDENRVDNRNLAQRTQKPTRPMDYHR